MVEGLIGASMGTCFITLLSTFEGVLAAKKINLTYFDLAENRFDIALYDNEFLTVSQRYSSNPRTMVLGKNRGQNTQPV